jgi:hypothetical protein
MPLDDLNEKEREVVRECLQAAVEGPFFPDWEFHTLFGLEREEVKTVLKSWPKLNEADETVQLAINNSLNNLLGYPHGCEEEWPQFISVSGSEVARILNKLSGKLIGGYFEGLR